MHVDKTANLVAVEYVKDFDLDGAPISATYASPPLIALRRERIGVRGLDLKETDLGARLKRQGVDFGVPNALLVPDYDFGQAHTFQSMSFLSLSCIGYRVLNQLDIVAGSLFFFIWIIIPRLFFFREKSLLKIGLSSDRSLF